MNTIILHMAALIACGVGWRFFRPGGLDADSTRQVLTTLVYYLLLPALVLKVLWQAPLDSNSLGIAFSAAVGVLSCMLISVLVSKVFNFSGAVTGAVVLAASIPNVTYMGLPVLESLYGDLGRSIAIQYDLFACTPILLTLGVLVSMHYGQHDGSYSLKRSLLVVPPLWAAVIGVTLNLLDVPMVAELAQWLEMLAVGVVPLMIFSLGLSLRWDTVRLSRLPQLTPIIVIQMLVSPVIVFFTAGSIGLEGVYFSAAVMEAAMPSMVIGIVFCDRYGLDIGLYAAAVTVTTMLSLISLPLWSELLM